MIPLLLIATLEVQLPPCRPEWLHAQPLIDLLAAETSTRTFSQLAISIPDCEGAPEQMEVTVTSSIGSATRTVSFTDVPRNTRLRALAVSIGELHLLPTREPASEPARAPAKEPLQSVLEQTSEPATEPISLFAAAGMRGHPDADTIAFRAQAGLTRSLWRPGAVSIHGAIDLGFATAERELELGRIRLFLVSAGTGAELRWSTKSLVLGLGPHLEVGWGSTSGSSAVAAIKTGSANALIAAASLTGSLRWSITDLFGLALILEAGTMLRGIAGTVDGRNGAGWRGAFAGATAGLFFDL